MLGNTPTPLTNAQYQALPLTDRPAVGSPFEESPCRRKHRLLGFVDRLGGENYQWRFVVELRIGRPEIGSGNSQAIDGLDRPDDPIQDGKPADHVMLAGLDPTRRPVAEFATRLAAA